MNLLKKYNHFVSAGFLFLFSFISLSAAENLIRNGGMELGEGNPANWGMWGWQMTNARFSLDSGGAYKGNRYATIVNNENNDARFIQEVLVDEGKIYKISGWIKTENVGQAEDVKGASICLLEDGLHSTRDIKGTNGKWEYVEFYLEVGRYVMKVTVSLCVGGTRKLNTGKASFDEVHMEEVTAVPAGAIHTKIDGKPEDLPPTPPPSSGDKKETPVSPGATAKAPDNAEQIPDPQNPQETNPMLIVIIILVLIFIAAVIILFFSPREEKKIPLEEEEEEEENDDDETGVPPESGAEPPGDEQ